MTYSYSVFRIHAVLLERGGASRPLETGTFGAGRTLLQAPPGPPPPPQLRWFQAVVRPGVESQRPVGLQDRSTKDDLHRELQPPGTPGVERRGDKHHSELHRFTWTFSKTSCQGDFKNDGGIGFERDV